LQDARRKEQFGAWEWFALALYTALVAYGARLHQSWADEGQAWLLARDCGLREIFLHRLHYEGTPGIWHLLLWTLERLHMPFIALHWMCAGIAVAGVAVWLRNSPMPRYLKLLFPFTFFMAYQYAVIARSYVLFPLMVFAACTWIGRRGHERTWQPMRLAVLLSLLANLCMYGTAAAGGFALLFAGRVWRRRGEVTPEMLRRLIAAATVFVLACMLAAATAWPAKDIAFTTGILDLPKVQKLLHRDEVVTVTAESPQPSWMMNPEDAKLKAPHTGHAWKDKLWRESHAFYNGALQQTSHVYRTQRFIFAMSLLMFPISGSMMLAYLLVAAMIYRCARQRAWLEMLPFLFVFGASVLIYSAEHHSGLLMVLLMAVAWLTWPQQMPQRLLSRGVEMMLQAVMLVVLVMQIGWTAHALKAERRVPYAGDRETAVFLHEHVAGMRVAGYYSLAPGVEVYFPHKIYFNQPSSYWQYSKDPRLTMSNEDVLAARPDYVVLGTLAFRHEMILNQFLPMLDSNNEEPGDIQHIGEYFEAHGYRETHRFCGQAPMRDGFSNELCQVVLEPVAAQ